MSTGRRRAPLLVTTTTAKISRADRRRRCRAHFAARRTRDGRPRDAPRASRRALGCVRDVARSPRGGAWTRARRRPRASPRAASPPVFSPFEPSDPAAIPAPQDLAYASLAAAYGLVALVALAQRAHPRARSRVRVRRGALARRTFQIHLDRFSFRTQCVVPSCVPPTKENGNATDRREPNPPFALLSSPWSIYNDEKNPANDARTGGRRRRRSTPSTFRARCAARSSLPFATRSTRSSGRNE